MRHTYAALMVGLLAGGMAVMVASAAEGEGADDRGLGFTYGGDIRTRGVYFDNIPIKADPPGITRNGDNLFYRFRTRLWAEGTWQENTALRLRLANEFRGYDKPDNDSSDPLDEIVVDNLYLDLKNLLDDTLDLRVGRQDLIYGNGRLLLEGTPKDGSRTIYFDAVKLSYRGIPDTTVDLLGIYNQPENELVIDSRDRDLTGWDSAYNDLTESGFVLYAKNRTREDLPGEAYYMYKRESDWEDKAGESVPRNVINTLGFRLMPKFSDEVDGNLEAAYQFGETGDEDMRGYMVDALTNWRLPRGGDLKPTLGLGWYYLSGDDPDSAKDEGWNPLWARWPQYSELYIYAFDADGAGRWSNLNMPHVDFSFAPLGAKWQMKLMLANLWAPEENGPGGGDNRGFLASVRNDFVLKENFLGAKDRLFGHVLFEALEPGDYYNVDDTGYFARLELSYAF